MDDANVYEEEGEDGMITKISHVSKSFERTKVLHQIDLSIGEGEFLAILGPSGCGKTTLLRLLAGFEQVTEGEILFDDRVVSDKRTHLSPQKRDIGMVFQSFALWPHMNILKQVLFPLEQNKKYRDRSQQERVKRAEEMLDLVGLLHLKERMPGELSGGQKQRVAIARALAPEPAILLMDEPLSSLDAKLRLDLRSEIQKIHRETNTSIVYVTHDQSEALAMADRIVVMNKGQIEQASSPKQIYLMPETPFVAEFVGKANLVPGVWNHHVFYPFGQKGVQWVNPTISPSIKSEGLYPIKPEDIVLSLNGRGVEGFITNVQFQGTGYHYTVETETFTIKAITNLSQAYHVGQTVKWTMKDLEMEKGIIARTEWIHATMK